MSDELLNALEREQARLLEEAAADEAAAAARAAAAIAKKAGAEGVARDIADFKKLSAQFEHIVSELTRIAQKHNLKNPAHPIIAANSLALENLTLSDLINKYREHDESPYRTVKHNTRQNYDSLLDRLAMDHGWWQIAELNEAVLLGLHDEWMGADKKHLAMASSLTGMVRGLAIFGSAVLKSPSCRMLRVTLMDTAFPESPRGQVEALNRDQVKAICAQARKMGFGSIALAQALQYDARLKQKECIGEYVPLSVPGTGVVYDDEKWINGIRWSDIDENWVLHYKRSRSGQPETVDLSDKPMVLEEIRLLGGRQESGPIIVYEQSGRPYRAIMFRRSWRKIADAAAIPKNLKNMGSHADDEDDGAEAAPEKKIGPQR